jgi:MFS family permease
MPDRLARGAALSAILAAVAIAFADSSIVVIALPEVLRRFDASVTGVAWVVTSYNVALAAASLALVALAARGRRGGLRSGLALFAASSIACGAAPSLATLVAFRAVQGLGGALLLTASLPAARGLAGARGVRLWAAAGLFGAAVGPAAGGLLTELAGWRSIFFAQTPLAAAALLARTTRGRPEPAGEAVAPVRRRTAANAALALASAALVGLLFLAVVLLIDVWRLSPLAAAAVVSAIPLGTLAAQPLARTSSRETGAAGVVLLAGGLAALALLPTRSIALAACVLALSGLGLGLVVPGLNRTALAGGPVAGTWTIWARHAGLVLGLLILTPLLSRDLTAAAERAKLQATAAVLDSQLPARAKLELAFALAPVLSHPPSKGLPSLEHEAARAGGPAESRLGRRLDSIVEGAVTRGFRTSLLVAALLGLCALAPLALASSGGGRRALRAPAVALALAAALVAGELAGGALAYGARPRVLPPCAKRASLPGSGADATTQRLVLRGLDLVACRAHQSREQLVLDLAGTGVDAADLVDRLVRYAGQLAHLPGWLLRLLRGG